MSVEWSLTADDATGRRNRRQPLPWYAWLTLILAAVAVVGYLLMCVLAGVGHRAVVGSQHGLEELQQKMARAAWESNGRPYPGDPAPSPFVCGEVEWLVLPERCR